MGVQKFFEKRECKIVITSYSIHYTKLYDARASMYRCSNVKLSAAKTKEKVRTFDQRMDKMTFDSVTIYTDALGGLDQQRMFLKSMNWVSFLNLWKTSMLFFKIWNILYNFENYTKVRTPIMITLFWISTAFSSSFIAVDNFHRKLHTGIIVLV